MASRYVGLGKETTYGIAAEATRYLEAIASIKPDQNWVIPSPIASRAFRKCNLGPYRARGNIGDFPVEPENIGELLLGVFGSDIVTNPYTGVYLHTFSPADILPSFTIRKGVEITERVLPGGLTEALTVKFAHDKDIMANAEVFSGFVETKLGTPPAPSLLGTSTTCYGVNYSYQRKSFYANGRFWCFYSDGTNMVYRTSVDGTTWTSATTIKACSDGYEFSVLFDGTYLHYVQAKLTSLYYRRGTPNANGSITWSAVEQTVLTTYNAAEYPYVSVDSNGYVWISYTEYHYTGPGANDYPFVIKSGNNDGTWGTTPGGFPHQLYPDPYTTWRTSVIPLTNGKMLAIYAFTDAGIKVKSWTGSAWGSEKTTSSLIQDGFAHSAVAEGDNVHIVFLKKTTYDILHVKYYYIENIFGAETTIQASAIIGSAPVLSRNPNTNNLYCFWVGSPVQYHVYYKKRIGETWDSSPTDWINESVDGFNDNGALTAFYEAYTNKIGLLYMTMVGGPFKVKFGFLAFMPQPVISPLQALNMQGATSILTIVGDVRALAYDLEITIKNNIPFDKGDLSGRTFSTKRAGQREVTGKISLCFNNTTEYDRFIAGTPFTLIVRADGPVISGVYRYFIGLELRKCIYIGGVPDVKAQNESLVIDAPFKAFYDSTDGFNAEAKATLQNTIAAY